MPKKRDPRSTPCIPQPGQGKPIHAHLSRAMRTALENVANRASWRASQASLAALQRRGLIEPDKVGRWMPTESGRSVISPRADPSIHPVQPEPFTTLELAFLVKHFDHTPSPGDPLMYGAFKSALRKLTDALDQRRPR